MEPPLHKFWETAMQELYRAANARYAWVKESTQKAILRPWAGNGTQGGADKGVQVVQTKRVATKGTSRGGGDRHVGVHGSMGGGGGTGGY